MLDNVAAIITCKFSIISFRYNLQEYKYALWLLIINSRVNINVPFFLKAVINRSIGHAQIELTQNILTISSCNLLKHLWYAFLSWFFP